MLHALDLRIISASPPRLRGAAGDRDLFSASSRFKSRNSTTKMYVHDLNNAISSKQRAAPWTCQQTKTDMTQLLV